MIDLNQIWKESLERFTDEGVQKISDTSPSELLLKGVETLLTPNFAKEIISLGIELLHEEIADVDNLR
jgi:hypothetical protein